MLNIEKVKLINHSKKELIKRIALCPGSAGSFIRQLKNVDLYITGDVSYHEAFEAYEIAVIDAGHMETEVIILEELKKLLNQDDLNIYIAQEKAPWSYL